MDALLELVPFVLSWGVVCLVSMLGCMALKQNPVWGLVFGPAGVIVAAIIYAANEVSHRLAISLHQRSPRS